MMIKSSEIASFLKLSLSGKDVPIEGYSSLSKMAVKTVVFAKKFTTDFLDTLNSTPEVLAIVTEHYRDKLMCSYLVSPNPRLDFIKVVSKYFLQQEIKGGIDPTAVISTKAKIGRNVTIGAHCFIGDEVTIGDGCCIMPNVTIIGRVEMGMNCLIKPGAVIGGSGFGFEYDEDNTPYHFPHTGFVKIGNNVHIGSNTCIDRATIDCTTIGDNVKIDNLCQIAHNCSIGKNTLITGHSGIAGGVQIGERCWIGPNSTIYQQLKIENGARVGIGSVVLRKVREGNTVFGNPATRIDYE